MPRTPFDLETQLARHGGALRHLACELLGGDAADDAMQETWLRTLQSPPRHAAGLGGWLAAILRNVAFRGRRGAARRRRREEEVAAARASAAEDHAAVLARTELAHRLLAAVESLEPPFRDAIWQRWFEGRQPREIAAAGGVPVATVKSRLQRGLGMLRERLGEREGADWRAGFAVAFGLGNEGTAAMAAAGGVLMATWTKVTAAFAAAAAIAAMAWGLRAPDQIAPTARSPASAPLALTAEGEAKVTDVMRDAVAAASAPSSPPGEAPAWGLARCRGRVVDAATKAPLAGAVVTLRRSNGQQAEASDLACTTRDDGAFVFEFTSEWSSPRLWFRAADHLMVWRDVGLLDAGQDDDVGDAALVSGRPLPGRIVDELGVPLPVGTVLRAIFRTSPSGSLVQAGPLEAPVGVDGAFCFEPAVPLGPVDFELAGGEHELRQQVIVTANEPAELTLAACRRVWIRGVVVDDAGTPLAGVRVAMWPPAARVETPADGSFTLLRPNRWAPPTTEVRIEHAPEFRVSHTPDVPWGTSDLRIVLQRAPAVPIEVVDDAGAAVEEFGVVLMRKGTEALRHGTVLQRGVHAGGRLAVEGIDPGKTSLRVVPVDARLSPSAMIAIATSELQRVVLARRVPCTVEVFRAGRPVEGARVEIVFTGPEGVKHQSLPGLLDPHCGERTWLAAGEPERVAEARTGDNGVASLLRDAASGQCALQVHADGRPPFVVREPVFPAHVELPGLGTIAGRVQLRGRHRGKAFISISGQVNQLLTPQPDGTFRTRPLAAGTWRVAFAGLDASARDVDVRDGETTVVDFDFADHPPAAVHGRLRRDGALPAGLTAELLRVVAGSRPVAAGTAAIGADGTFVIGELQSGTYRLALRSTGTSSPAMPAMLADTYVLAAGEQLQLDVPFPPRRLVVRLQRADGSPAKGVKVLTRCDGVQWPSFGFFAAPVDDVLVFDPAPMLPVEFAAYANQLPVWSAPVVMPPDRAEAEVTVVLPDAPR